MARHSRQPSGTGIYHVMMRGINYQNIFEEHEDYSYNKQNDLVNTPLSDDVACLDIEDTSKGRPSDNQVMLLIIRRGEKGRLHESDYSKFKERLDGV